MPGLKPEQQASSDSIVQSQEFFKATNPQPHQETNSKEEIHTQHPDMIGGPQSKSGSFRKGKEPYEQIPLASFKTEIIVELVVSVVLIIVSILCNELVPPHLRQRDFWKDEHSIAHTHYSNEILEPYWVVLFMAICLIPCALIELFVRNPRKRGFKFFCLYILSLIVSFACQFTLLIFLKLAVARLRPDFISRCDPEWDDPVSEFSHSATCKAAFSEDKDVKKVFYEGRLSFPSGHTANMFWASAASSMYLIHFTEPFHAVRLAGVRFFICLIPYLFGIFTGISRSLDNRHHPTDIVCGALLGLVCGILGDWLYKVYIGHWHGENYLRFHKRSGQYMPPDSSSLRPDTTEQQGMFSA